MVAITQITLLLTSLAALSAAAPAKTVQSYGGSEALAMQIFTHTVTDGPAGQLCSADSTCKDALQKLDAKKPTQAASTTHQKRKVPGLSLFGGPWGLAYSLAMSTSEGQKIHGYAVSELKGLCDKDATCKGALSKYETLVAPVVNKVDNTETDAENAVLGKAESALEGALGKVL